jgi:hypothetical protein
MKQSIPITLVMMGALLGGGCATKKYVRQTVDPVRNSIRRARNSIRRPSLSIKRARLRKKTKLN